MQKFHRERETRARISKAAVSLVLVLLAVMGGLIWLGWKWRQLVREQTAMAEIQGEIDNGRFGLAARGLGDLLTENPSADEARYWLGFCEQQRGRPDEAAEAWAGVSPTSPYAPKAMAGRLETLFERGRLADAEQLVREALDDPRVDGSGLSILLGPIYCQQGRLDECSG